jgi:hypothetical protein
VLIEDGFLSRFVTFSPPRSPDLSGVRTRMGDCAVDELSAAMSRGVVITGAVDEYERRCPGASAIAFCVNIEHSHLWRKPSPVAAGAPPSPINN